MNFDINILITIGGSIVAWVTANKWIFPLIGKTIASIRERRKAKEDRAIDVSKELNGLKTSNIALSQQHFETLLGQIDSLESQLKEYASELRRLRAEILDLNAQLYDKDIVISKLRQSSCSVKHCPQRALCQLTDLNKNDNE